MIRERMFDFGYNKNDILKMTRLAPQLIGLSINNIKNSIFVV